jgi:hypothetical protein
MSCFICSDKHFATVAKALFIQRDKQQRFADALKRENIKSVNHRYSERNRFKAVNLDSVSLADVDKFNHHDIMRLLQCIDYQSSDAPDYDDVLFNMTERYLTAHGADANKSQPNLWSI